MAMPEEYRKNAQDCLRLVDETGQIYAKIALIELANKFRATAEEVERRRANQTARAQLEQRISNGKDRIAKQRKVIEHLRSKGRDFDLAVSTLHALEHSVRSIEHCRGSRWTGCASDIGRPGRRRGSDFRLVLTSTPARGI